MHVLILNYEYPPLGGGAANATKHLVDEYAKKGLRVTVVTSSVSGRVVDSVSETVRVIRVPVGKRDVHHWRFSELFWYLLRARKEMARLSFDVVHCIPSSPCFLLALGCGRRVLSLRGSDVPGFNTRLRVLDFFVKPFYSLFWKRSVVVANSSGLKELALRTSRTDISIIPNGVEKLPVMKVRKRKLRLLFVGRLVERKGIRDVITAVKGLDVSLSIVGDGVLREELEALACENVTFFGALEHSEVVKMYSKHDVYIQTPYHEGMSNTMLEALSAGMPMILSRCEGVEEIFCENGVLVEAGDVQGIREAIDQMNYLNRKRWAEASREHAKNFTWETVAEQYVDVYESV